MRAYGLGSSPGSRLNSGSGYPPIEFPDALKIDSHKKKRKTHSRRNCTVRNTVCVARERQPATVLTATRLRRSTPLRPSLGLRADTLHIQAISGTERAKLCQTNLRDRSWRLLHILEVRLRELE